MPIGQTPDKGGTGASGSSGFEVWFETLAQMGAAPGPAIKTLAWQMETGAPYEFLPGDTTTVNGWTVVGNTGGVNGRWILRAAEVQLSPIDGTVTDDAARLNLALTAFSGVAEVTLFPKFTIVAGVITVLPFIIASGSVTLNNANLPIKVKGIGSGVQVNGVPAGPATRLLWKGATASPVISVSNGQSTVVLRDMAVDNSATGGSLASHAIYAEDSDQFQVENVVIYPANGLGFSTAGIELGRPAGGHGVSKAHIKDCTIRNCTVGTRITDVIIAKLTSVTQVDCSACSLIGSATTTAYGVSFVGCTFEARISHTGCRVVRGVDVTFYGCQFDAWDATHYGFEILSTAALASSISFYGCRFTGNTVPYGVKIDFADATVGFSECYFSGFTTASINNANNRRITIIDCKSDDINIPLINSFTVGSVRVLGCDVATAGITKDRFGGPVGGTGVAIDSFLELGAGTQTVSGLIRFPKPSEQSILATIRREASAVDIPVLTSTTDTGLIVGDVGTGTFNVLKLQASTQVETWAPTFYWRDAGATIRGTWTIALATLYDIPNNANATLDFRFNGTSRIRMDSSSGFVLDNGPRIVANAGTPEGAVTAPVGSICTDTTNGELYIKNTGTGNTGWKLMVRTP